MCVEKAFREKKCDSSKFELARFHQVTDEMSNTRGEKQGGRGRQTGRQIDGQRERHTQGET